MIPPSVELITRANTRDAYDLLYSRDDLLKGYLDPSRLEFYQEVAGYCSEISCARIVDLGCGTGHLLQAIDARMRSGGRQAELYGMDHSQAAVLRASTLLKSGKFLVGDILATGYETGFFDLVLSTETFEHLLRPDLALVEATRICRAGGAVVLTVPNGDLDTWEGHVNFWNAERFAAFLTQNSSLEVVRLLTIAQGQALLAHLAKIPTAAAM